jgi:hypothetical protein
MKKLTADKIRVANQEAERQNLHIHMPPAVEGLPRFIVNVS